MMMKEVRESRPEVGSSRTTTDGSLISSKAMDVLFFSPPEIPLSKVPPTYTSRHFSNLNFLTSVIILVSFSYSGRFNFKLAANSSVSLTVRVSMSTSCCMT